MTYVVLPRERGRQQPATTIQQPATTIRYIASLDGVRALAVLGVMAYHGGASIATGGFLGVDAFFVLSGFLITTLLVNEWRSTGTIRLGAFWARRARRLLPALLLVLLFVAAYAAFAVPRGTYPGLRGDSIYTLFYVANWHFIFAGANYFTANGPVSPLTHTWSLAVEEQFYLVWPLVVLGVMGLTRKLRTLLLVCIVGTLASALEMALLYGNGLHLTRLYYGTDTHAQSMLTGATLAVALAMMARARRRSHSHPRLPTGPRARRSAPGGDPAWAARSMEMRCLLTAVGLAGLVVDGYLWTQANGNQSMLYHGGFLLAALATAGVIVSAVCAQRAIVSRMLSLRPLRFLGMISYGLYLWHFPLFLWLDHARTGLNGFMLFAFRFCVTFVVATLSYYLVEQPIRRGTLVKDWRAGVLTPLGVGTVAGVMVLATVPIGASAVLATGHSHVVGRSTTAVTPGNLRVLLVGDSMAQTLGNGIEGTIAGRYGLDIDNRGDPNCALSTGTFQVQANPPQAPSPPCDPASGDPGWPSDWTTIVDQDNPSVSVFLARLDVMNRMYDGHWVSIGDPAYDDYLLGQMRTAVRVLSSKGGKVVFLTSPYYSTGERPNGTPWPEDDPARVDSYNSMLRQVAKEFPGVAYIVDLNKIADPGGAFQSTIDNVDVRFSDGIHWTFAGDTWLAPRILPQIQRVGMGQGGTSVDVTDLKAAGY